MIRLTIGTKYRIDGLGITGRHVDTLNRAWTYQGTANGWTIWAGPTGIQFVRPEELTRVGRQHLEVQEPTR